MAKVDETIRMLRDSELLLVPKQINHEGSDLSVENHTGIWSHFNDYMLRGHSEEQ